MPRGLTLAALLISAPILSGPVLAAPPPISLFGQLPNIATIELSPDGSRWAAVMGDETAAQIQVRSLPDNKPLSVTAADRSKVRDVMWVGNDHVVATITTTQRFDRTEGPRREWSMLLGLDLKRGKQWRPLLNNIPDTMNVAAGTPRAVVRDGQPILVVPAIHYQGTLAALALVDIPLEKGDPRVGMMGDPDTGRFILDGDGRPVAREDYNDRTGEWRLLLNGPGGFRRIHSETAPIDRPRVIGFGRDTGTLVLASRKSGSWEDYEISRSDGRISGPTSAYPGDRLLVDRRSRAVIGTIDIKLDGTDYLFFDAKDQAMWRGITRAFPGERVTLESISDDHQVLIVEVEGEKNGVSLFRVDRAKGEISFLADRYNGLGPEQIGPVTSFTYKAADGLTIPAYLTLPRGRLGKKLPLVVLAHGGPAARDYAGFDWWAQALASRGYAVLQPQFRGSTGFGLAHTEAGYGEWGRKMQTDLSDGVRDLVARGIVDPARVCIVGASYGGYAAMAGVTLDPGVYRCASAVAGVSDLRRMLASEVQDTGGRQNSTLRYWQRFMGAKGVGDTSIDAWSPARLAAKVTVPLQLIHGKDDTVVPIEQSRLMRDAMAKAGTPVEYLELPGEDHWLSRPATRIAMLEAQVAFLERHNPPD